jgi:integrase
MARKSTGAVVERHNQRGTTYALRFTAYGERRYVTLGTDRDGWTRRRAEEELANVLADVRRGRWQPEEEPEPAAEAEEVPTFHVFASEWLAGRQAAGLRPRTLEYLEWALSFHLLRHFKAHPVDQITPQMVDRYMTVKATERRTAEARIAELEQAIAARHRSGRPTSQLESELREMRRDPGLSNSSINKTLDVLSAILAKAVAYGHLPRNPAQGKEHRLPSERRQWSGLDRADHISALLDGASEVDARALTRRGQRRALLATLVFAGLRIGEALDLRWRDVDLARGTITIRAAKTDAGVRTINLLPVLGDELRTYRAQLASAPATARVFGTGTGGRASETNVRRRILAPAVEAANAAMEELGEEALPRLTPHSLRKTFCLLLVAIGEDPAYAMEQMGHTDATFTLRVYTKARNRRDGERERLRALVQGGELAPIGTAGAAAATGAGEALAA